MSTILLAQCPLTKVKSANGRTVKGYPRVQTFKAVERDWKCLDDIAADLDKLQRRTNAAVIRGGLTQLGRQQAHVLRRAYQDPKHFQPVERDWIALDIDGAPAPAELRFGNAQEHAQRALDRAQWLVNQYLPAQLAQVSCVIQWTASEGFDSSKVYARIWMMATEEAPDHFYRDWIKEHQQQCPELDTALYNPVQPHYTAPPIIQNGPAPVSQRICRLDQTFNAVDIQQPLQQWRSAQEQQHKRRRSKQQATSKDERAAQAAIAKLQPDSDYQTWVKVGMALHDKWPDPAGFGFALWDEWSQAGAKYKPGQTQRKWATFASGRGTSFASLVRLGRPPQERAQQRKTIDLAGDLQDRAQTVLRAIQQDNGQQPVTFRWDAVQMARIIDDDGAQMELLSSAEQLRQHLTARFRWRKFKLSKDGDPTPEPCDIPLDVCKHLMAAPKQTLPRLRKVSTAPQYDLEGKLWRQTGYARSLATYFSLSTLTLERFDSVQSALDFLWGDLLPDFPFKDESSRVHALALLLLPLVRSMIPGPTPLHLVTAPLPRTGKTKLVNVCALATSGQIAQLCPPSKDNEEWRKQITATLRSAPAVALIDNLEPGRNTSSTNLAALLTSKVWTARELGTNRNVSLPNDTIWTATGNNPALSRELADRCVWIHLDPASSDPSSRCNFQQPFIETYAQKAQGRICGALACLVDHWLQSKAQWAGSLGGFEHWSKVIGGILEACGLGAHLLANRAWMRKRISPAQDEWSAFVLAWYLAFVSTPATATELFNLADDEGLLDTARGAGNERSQKTKIGIALRGMTDRHFTVIDPNTGQDMTLQVTDGGAQTRTRAKTYKLVKV